MRTLARLFVAAVLVSAAAAAPAPGKLRILATVLPLQEFASAIAGDSAEVGLLLPAGAGVHTWQPRPGDIARLAECDLLLFIGSGLEPWLPGLVSAMPAGRLRTFEAAAGLTLPEAGEESHGKEEHAHGPLDPHVWLDFGLDVALVERIAAELTRIDPAGASAFASRAADLAARLRALDARFRDGLSACRGKDIVLAGHGAFGYIARRYGLNQRSLYGLSPDSQPRPKDVMAAVDFCKERGIKTVFSENSVPADLSRTLAREIGGRVLVLHTAHNLTRDQQDRGVGFFELMEEDLASLRDGLGCH
jgi:zinc transport system substrate-binding protein